MRSARVSAHFRLEALAPGVHAAVATAGGHGLCNAGIVDLGDDTVVFDTMLTPSAGSDLYTAAKRLTGRPPKWAVNSHWHGDHIWGNSSFVGSHIISSGAARAEILKRSRRQFDGDRREMRRILSDLDRPDSLYAAKDRPLVRAWFEGVVQMPRTHRIVPPDITFEERLVFEGRRRSLHLVTHGGGHSPSDVFAYLPDDQIILTGDLAIQGFHPSLGDGWPDRWASILNRLEKYRAQTILPGHGPPGTGKVLSVTRDYLEEVDRLAQTALRRSNSLRSLLEVSVPTPFRDWRFGFMFRDNLARAYRLARAKSRSERRPA